MLGWQRVFLVLTVVGIAVSSSVTETYFGGDDTMDECQAATCAMNMLQRRGKSLMAAGYGAEGLERLEGVAMPVDLLEVSLCNGTEYDLATQGCCGGQYVFDLTKEGCCGDSTVYTFTTQGCCNEKTVFDLSKGCQPDGAVEVPGSLPSALSQFTCGKDWPIRGARRGWNYYCDAKPAKAWAMTKTCTYAWYNVSASSKKSAEEAAVDICTRGAGEECIVLDLEGSLCSQHAKMMYCNGVPYDAEHEGCCGGLVYDIHIQECCEGPRGTGTVFKRANHACCAGRVYPTGYYGCCGGRKLFRTSTHGCCLDAGVELFALGKQNCCRKPPGVCTIRHGQYSCCH